MGLIVKALEHVAIGKALEAFGPSSANEKLGTGLMALSCFLAVISIGLAIYSAFLWFAARYPLDFAVGMTALVTLGFAVLIVLFYAVIVFAQRWRMRQLRQEIERTLNYTLELLDGELAETIRENPKLALTLASVSGFLLGDQIH